MTRRIGREKRGGGGGFNRIQEEQKKNRWLIGSSVEKEKVVPEFVFVPSSEPALPSFSHLRSHRPVACRENERETQGMSERENERDIEREGINELFKATLT